MTTTLAFVFVLGVLIFVHELGHFLVARWYGVRVHVFSLGFGPKLLKFRRGDTEYCVSAIPLGGYVKLAGETVEDERTGSSDEFLSKSKWVRFQVYLAGPVMNLLLAVVVLAGVLTQGADEPLYESQPPVIERVEPGSPAARAGLAVGDRIVSLAGQEVPTWSALSFAVLPRANQELVIVVERQGARVEARVTPDAVTKFELGSLGIGPVVHPQVLSVTARSPADRAGLQAGDVIVAADGREGISREALIEYIRTRPDVPIAFSVRRGGATLDVTIVPERSGDAGLVGIGLSSWETRRIDPGLAEAFVLSLRQNWEVTREIGRTLRRLVTRDTPVRQLMGPLAIAELSGSAASAGLLELFRFMAFISLNLGLLNLLPIPVLDGGHIAILAVEGAARRDLSVKVKERILIAGAAMIVLLMVTVIYNDILRFFR